MCFRWLYWLLCLLLVAVGLSVQAEPVAKHDSDWQLQITPAHCVSLEPERPCYAEVKVLWQHQAAADSSAPLLDVCLYLGSAALKCWQNQASGDWRFEFAQAQSERVELRVNGKSVAQTMITVSWVQQNNRHKRHWRLF